MALISFLCASYNHGRYVDAFLRSVFAQSVPDWELVIVDDCSTDDNLDVIAKHSDARIRIVRHKRNEGMTKSLQDAFLASSSPVVAWVASDDMLECRYAETVLRTLKDHPEADVVYTPLLYMNEDGTSTGRRSHLPIGKTRQELVAEMFVKENLLHSPGMAVRRDAFSELLPLNIGMLQLSDYQIHLRLLCGHAPILLPDPIVRYRVSRGSACARNPPVLFRESAEIDMLMDTVGDFIDTSKSRFDEYFGSCSVPKPILDSDVPFLLGLLAMQSPLEPKRLWGLKMMMRGLSTADAAQGIWERYGIDYSRFMRISAEGAPIEQVAGEQATGDSDVVVQLRRRLRKYKALTAILCLAFFVVGGLCVLCRFL